MRSRRGTTETARSAGFQPASTAERRSKPHQAIRPDSRNGLARRPAVGIDRREAVETAPRHPPLAGPPVPRTEWPALSRSLGLDLLSRLLGISHSSARRYLSGTRTTPKVIAARLHFLALVAGDLAGAYNEIGVRRWFDRKRSALGGKTPAEVLTGDWSAEDDGPERVRDLAAALSFSPAT